MEKCPAIVYRIGVIRVHSTRRTPKKINELRYQVLPPYSPLDFNLFRSPQQFLSGKTFGLSPKCHLQIFCSKNQLIFIGLALKICTLDGKRLLITWVIPSLIKNKNLLKIYLFEFNIKKDFLVYDVLFYISSY